MDKYTSCKDSEKGAETENLKKVDSYVIEDSREAISYYEELQLLTRFGALDDSSHDIVSPPFQARGDGIRILSSLESQPSQPNEEKSYIFPSASLEILRHRTSKVGAVNGKKINGLSYATEGKSASPSTFSANQIIELAAWNFIQLNSGTRSNVSAISHPYASSYLGLSTENTEDIQLVQYLLSCAEKVSNQQYDCASKHLVECNKLSFRQNNMIQRLVYYFTEALLDKIGQETGRFTGKSMMNNWFRDSKVPSSAAVTFLQKLPLNQVTQFAGIQSMVDHISTRRKVHIIDLEMRSGIKLITLMQALAARSECPVKHFKITALTTNSNLVIEDTGVRLKSLAKSLNLNFSFHVVSFNDILDVQRNVLYQDPEETVVVHAAYALKFMITKQNLLETLMRMIRNINPHLMIITEAEANINSPVFVNRFVEALFYYGAYFDCMEICLKNDVAERALLESKLFSPGIRNVVAADGEERRFRMVSINVWREFFARFGMVETDLGKLALHHAKLVVNRFECGDSCTLGLNGKCLIVGWKGTPICSLSAWKFQGTRSI